MTKLSFITEESARELIESEVKANLEKGYIKSPEGFVTHLIDTGRIAYDVASQICKKHPSLRSRINPDALRVEGYFHDFGKIKEGENYHEVSTAHTILTDGEKLGIVVGGSSSERKAALKEMGSIVPPDYALFETLGGNNFPEGAVYPEIDNFIERVQQLRRDLSYSRESLTIEEFGLPFTLNQQIGLYADLTNVGGKRVSVSERVNEIGQRYGNEEGDFYDPVYAELTRQIRPRVLVVGKIIENFLQ